VRKLVKRHEEGPEVQQAVGKRPIKFSVQADDIEQLLDYACEAGAEKAMAVRVADLTFRESRRRKCEVPGCPSYLTNMHCPPKTPDARWMQSCLPQAYESGILAVMYSSEQEVAFPHQLRGAGVWSNKTDKLVERIESRAQALGYYKAMGFSCGACALCGMWTQKWIIKVLAGEDARKCAVLDGRICLLHRRSRPSAEACGVNLIELIRAAGLAPTHLIFPEVSPDAVPRCPWYALVLVG
jgi:predicted metal-binding protein